jgi:hypothetical protein
VLLAAGFVVGVLQGVAVQTWEVAPAALTKEYLVQRLGHHMAPAAAEKALQALARLVEGVMDEKGMLKKNPRKLDWAALAAKDPGEQGAVCWRWWVAGAEGVTQILLSLACVKAL